MTQSIVTIGSGRCGTYLIHKILSLYSNVESHHEFCIEHTQKLSVLYRAGLTSMDHAVLQLRDTHLAAYWYSRTKQIAFSDNKLSFLIKPLRVILPDTKFIYLVRDGRRVCASFFHKLENECYVEKWVKAVGWYMLHPRHTPPPPLKPCWWPGPAQYEPEWENFYYKWNRWQRLCWYWQDVNKWIEKDLESQYLNQAQFFKLEELVTHENDLMRLLTFVGLPWKDEAWVLCQRPQNVSEPVSYPLTEEQEKQYFEICGPVHKYLDYDENDYVVEYKGSPDD